MSRTGVAIPAIGLGTWPMRGIACRDAVRTALDAGYRHVDTAAMYRNEDAVGDGIRDSSVARADVFITTKVWSDSLRDGDLQRSAEQSARRLGVEAVDLLLIHWPNLAVPLAETIGALNEVRRRGLTRNIGVSNFDADLLRAAVRLSDAPIVADQVAYAPGRDQRSLLAACREVGAAFISYSPLAASAMLSRREVVEIAARHGRTPAQVVLRWHVQQGCIAIPKSSDPHRIRENLAVFDFALSAAEMGLLSTLR